VWTADRKPEDNPYFGYVAGADALVVTGDSESMIAEACATGKPVYVYEIPEKAKGPIACSADWILRKAYSRPMKRRKGTVRPQQGLEYLCARAIERGYVYAPRDLAGFYRELYEGGYARPFDENRALDREGRRLLEAPEVARRVRALLGFEEAAMSRAA
jgi:mitochondrial fission protein ELM1